MSPQSGTPQGMPDLLRALVDRLQFAELATSAAACWRDSAELAALPLWALAHAQLGERVAAEEVLAELSMLEPALDLDARVDLAAVQLLLGQFSEGLAMLDAVVAAAPDHALGLARLGFCRMQQGRLDEALVLYQRSAQLAPQRLPVLHSLVRLQMVAGAHEAAQRQLDQAIASLQAQHEQLPETAVQALSAQLRGLQLELWLARGRDAEAEAWLSERREQLALEDWVALVLLHASLLAGRDRHADAEAALRDALRHAPEDLALLGRLSELAQLQGRSAEAAQLLRRCIQLTAARGDDAVALWSRLSGVLLHPSPEAAHAAALRATELAAALQVSELYSAKSIAGLRATAALALAASESQRQNYEQAEALFVQLLEDNPCLLPALKGLGHQHLQCGRLDEALALFERIKALDPVSGHAALISARRFPDDEASLQRLEQLARQPSLEGSTRSSLLLQLAAAWEQRKNFDKAFALADEANAASRKLLRYDPVTHRQRCARIRHAFSRALYEHRPGLGNPSTLPVFVLGMPRSGTTLVEQILAGHSQIHGAGELGVIPGVIAGLERWERHTGSGRHYPDCVDDLSAEVVAGITANVLKELQDYAPEARHVVDKLPHNFENVGLIKLLFPHARIISVRRDPRDIAISNYFTDYAAKHGGMGFAYDLGWIGEQLADHNLLMHHWQQIFPGEILEVSYEDVVTDAEGQARRMLDYIGVPWEPQVLNFNELERPVKTASVWQVRQPIYTTSKAKWECYREHLAPLIRGTNAKIEWQPITDMATLPEPGLLDSGVALYREDRLDEAEYRFQQLRHHLPEHAAANFMVGLIYVRKGHLPDGIALMEKALKRCPWNKNWRNDLARAYGLVGLPEKAAALQPDAASSPINPMDPMDAIDPSFDAVPIGVPIW